MILSQHLATEIVKRIKQIIGYDINIIDSNGIIVGSTNHKRIDSFHQGSVEVIKTKKTMEIFINDIEKFKGVKPGVNLPIIINNNIVGVVGITGEPDKVRQYGEVVKTMVELMLRESLLTEQMQNIRRAKEIFAYNLIHGNLNEIDAERIIMQGKLYDYNLAIPRLCVVFDGTVHSNKEIIKDQRTINNIHDPVNSLLAHDLYDKVDNILIPLGEGTSAVLFSVKENYKGRIKQLYDFCELIYNRINAKLKGECYIGIGSVYSSIIQIQKSYKEAVKSIKLGKMIKEMGIDKESFPNNIFHIDALSFYTFLDSLTINHLDYSRKYARLDKEMFTLLDNTLIETLFEFLNSNLNLSKASQNLYIHRNTLLYRLDKIEQLTGKNPRIFNDALELKLGLTLDYIKETKKKAPSS